MRQQKNSANLVMNVNCIAQAVAVDWMKDKEDM